MRKTILSGIQVLLIGLLAFGAQAATIHTAVPAQQHPSQNGLHKAGQMSKASSALAWAFGEYRAHVNQRKTTAFKPSNQFLQYFAGRVAIDARATGQGGQLLDDLEQLGLTHGARAGEVVSGLFPIAAVDEAVALSSLRSIAASPRPITHTTHAGSITSQGDLALAAAAARSAYGVNGAGVTVGVLSDAYDTLGGAAADVLSGDLPLGGVTVLPNGEESEWCGTLVFCIDEGRAMLQIVYDMAPGAELLFHTGLGGKAAYANAIDALAAAGADIIVDDLMYLNEPMFQDGVVAQAVDSATAGGVAYYSAAGNAGRNSYAAPFDGSGVFLCIDFIPDGLCDPIYELVGEMHNFDPGPGPGVDPYQEITIPINGVLTVAMQWDEPFGGPGPSGARNDHDIVLLSANGGIYFAISANDNVTTGEGWEVLQFQNHEVFGYGTTFALVITYDDIDSIAPPATLIKTVVFGSATIDELQTNSSTLIGHANAAGAQAVGAAFFADTPAYSGSPPVLEPYSSAGGTPILFDTNGTPWPTAEIRPKPEMTAVDGVNTTFFFDDSYGDALDDFFGTSAAAPHAAGVAALMLQAQPGATPTQLKSALQSSAIDMGTAGFDNDSGYGLIQADSAITALLASAGNNPPSANFTTSMADLQVDFTDMSTDPDGSVMSWEWDFGDGPPASFEQNPSHSSSDAGTYTVTLNITDDGAAPDSTSQAVTVTAGGGNAPPVASFTYACAGRDCSFTDTSTDPDPDPDPGCCVTSRNWDFGDGSPASTEQNPSHPYGSNGPYTVTLTVTDDLGAPSTSASASFRVKRRGDISGSSVGGSGGGGGDSGTGGSEKGRKKCTDTIDNDGDGFIDGADPDCQ